MLKVKSNQHNYYKFHHLIQKAENYFINLYYKRMSMTDNYHTICSILVNTPITFAY